LEQFEDFFFKKENKYANIKIMPEISIWETFVYESFVKADIMNENGCLPIVFNLQKDTVNYLLTMNAKTEFVERAILTNPWNTTHFAWIDFSIAYIFKEDKIDYTMNFLRTLATRTLEPKFLAIPGCWDPINLDNTKITIEKNGKNSELNMNTIVDKVCWRFCGGFFLGDQESLLDFHQLYKDYFYDFLVEYKRITWEVNFWAYLEAKALINPIWYSADHNDSIINNLPIKIFGKCLAQSPSFQKTTYEYPLISQYANTSASYCCHLGKHYLNTRYVNYILNDNGTYIFNHPNKKVITKNICAELEYNQESGFTVKPDSWSEMQNPTDLISKESCWYGLEDIRLYTYNNQMKFIATSIDYTPNNRIRMIIGNYDISKCQMSDTQILEPPTDTWCEKNWIPFQYTSLNDTSLNDTSLNQEMFIYKWSPMEIGRIIDNNLVIEITHDTSNIPLFSHVRGSTIFAEYTDNRFLVGVVHFSEEGSPRNYYHMLVLLEKDTYKPIGVSETFYFENRSIEFCIGFAIVDSKYHFWISKMDRDTTSVKINIDEIPIHLFE
jgi:hypothetical protein